MLGAAAKTARGLDGTLSKSSIRMNRQASFPFKLFGCLTALGSLVPMARMHRLLAACILILTAGCSSADDPLRWTEEVRLPDGRAVTLTREQRFDEVGYLAGYWLEFLHPETKEKVRFDNRGYLRTAALYVLNGEAHLILTPTFAIHMDAYGCPNPPYLTFKYVNGGWLQLSWEQAPRGAWPKNVTLDPKYVRAQIRRYGHRVPVDAVPSMVDAEGAPPVADLHVVSLPVAANQTLACPERREAVAKRIKP